jgi:MerR family transcriptional regulator, mercuric resistance operon regulatory protein
MPDITVSRGPALTIGALSKHTGVNIETIRFYERAGILPHPPRREHAMPVARVI